MTRTKKAKDEFIPCTPKVLSESLLIPAAETACAIEPANRPPVQQIVKVVQGIAGILGHDPQDETEIASLVTPQHVALLTTKWWGSKGVHRTVSFKEKTAPELAQKIVHYMNLWGTRANIDYNLFGGNNWQEADCRISRAPGGYYSYLGSDSLHIPRNQNTMNLEAFTLKTPDSEYERVIAHEALHDCGAPHEHMRGALIARLDRAKTIAYFGMTQGWSAQEVIAQVLTPLDERSLMGTPPDEDSIMTYQIPGSCTKDGKPIRGGAKINESDYAFIASKYPKATLPLPPAPPAVGPPAGLILVDAAGQALGRYDLTLHN